MRLLTIVGTRPELIRLCDWEKEIIFTGQHYDYELSGRFIKRLYLTIHYLPDNINHEDTDDLVKHIQIKLKELERIDCIIVHGDTRSALAGALASHQLGIKLAHTEAGVRCYDPNLLEEKYRKTIDHLADFNFCPVPSAVENLMREGITEGVYFVGDILYDKFLKTHKHKNFVFVTIHRRENIENEERLRLLIDNLKQYNYVFFPIHPHTYKCLNKFNIEIPDNITLLSPLDYEKTLYHIRNAKLILTDSGGIEREAFWSGTPCKVLRDKSEWEGYTKAFGEGNAGDKIYQILKERINAIDKFGLSDI